MEPLAFVMAILGCGEGDAPCREVTTMEQSYRSQAECLAASEDVLARQSDLLFPSIVAQCRPANGQVQLIRGSEVELPTAPRRNPFNFTPRMASNEPLRPQR